MHLPTSAEVSEPSLSTEAGATLAEVPAVASASVAENINKIDQARLTTKANQVQQANRMLSRNKKKINSFNVGDYVLLKTEGIDRSIADPVNLLCIILEKKDVLFKLGCKVGILDSMFGFNAFEKTELVTTFLKQDIPDKKISVREAIRSLSVGHGQGVLKCNCKAGKCDKCSCAKASQKCNSRCHGGYENNKCLNKI